MKIEFTQWLQEEIETFAVEKTEKMLKEKYPNAKEEGRYISVNFYDAGYGQVDISWDASRPGTRDRYSSHEGTEHYEIRSLLREYIKE